MFAVLAEDDDREEEEDDDDNDDGCAVANPLVVGAFLLSLPLPTLPTLRCLLL